MKKIYSWMLGMWDLINSISNTITDYNGINDKEKLIKVIKEKYSLEKKKSVYVNKYFSIRFSKAKTLNFSNTVLSLSVLKEYDNNPFLVCVICPERNYLLLSNTTFLKKISHSSHNLSLDNIKGSFNGSDIFKYYDKIENKPKNFKILFELHQTLGFEFNLQRLVEETLQINPVKNRYLIKENSKEVLIDSPKRALAFINSKDYNVLKQELDLKVTENSHFIYLASLIPNINIRGRLIEYLISGEDEELLEELKSSLVNKQASLPEFKTEDDLGDYKRIFDAYYTETDIKTKLMFLNSNPKAYNIDKMLEFLSVPKSVFLFYFIDIDMERTLETYLISMFDERIIDNTRIQFHWAGRNSRGVTQLNGSVIRNMKNTENKIELVKSNTFLEKLIEGHVA